MRCRISIILCLALAGCAKQPIGKDASHYATQKLNSFDVSEPSVAKAEAPQGPQIAYSYELGYLLDDAHLANVQAKQVALCNRLGAARCRVAKTTINKGSDSARASGETKLLVDARIAVAFQQRLDDVATSAGGEMSDRSTTAEDITKDVIDTDARVRAKQALADRLMQLIGQSNGKVADLVAAEQAFATTQEELDAARSLQASLRQRVAMSEVDVTYSTREASGVWAPVRHSFASLGGSFAGSIAALVTFAVVALPWLVVLSLLIWGLRRIGWRWPFRKRVRNAVPS